MVRGVVLLLCLLVAVNAQTFSISSVPATPVGIYSDYIYIVASVAPNVTVTLTLSEATGEVQFSPSNVLTFTPTTRSASIRLISSVIGNYAIESAVNGDEFVTPNIFGFSSVRRNAYVDSISVSTVVGIPSQPLKIWVDVPSTEALSFVIVNDLVDLVISPNPVVIPAGQRSASFVVRADIVFSKTTTTYFLLSGPQSEIYANISTTNTFTYTDRTWNFSPINPTLGVNSNNFYVYTTRDPNATFTVTPQSANTQFNPASVQLGPGKQFALVSAVTTAPDSSRTIFGFASDAGENFYVNQAQLISINVPLKTVTVTLPSVYVIGHQTYLSLTLASPVIESLTVTLSSSDAIFNTTTVTFSGNTTAIDVGITVISFGTDSILFQLGGNDAAYYTVPAAASIPAAARRGSFSVYGAEAGFSLYAGVESHKYFVRPTYSPKSSITIVPYHPDLKFFPSSLTFTADEVEKEKGLLEKSFTITPLYINDGASATVNFFVTGADREWFNAPNGFGVALERREIQVVWSPHLYGSNSRTLENEYEGWASVNFINKGESVSVTPVNPYFTFTPSVLYFDADHTRIQFTAKPIAVVTTTVNYVVGGKDGGWYIAPTSETYVVSARYIELYGAVLVPDNRVKAEHAPVFLGPTTSELAANHIYSFTLRTGSLPKKSVTITPKSSHATFSPSSRTLKAGDAIDIVDLEKQTVRDDELSWFFNLSGMYNLVNFTVKPQASGLHKIWFVLTGDDAQYYDTPSPITVNLKQELRPDWEPYARDHQNSAAVLIPSVFAIFSLIAAMLL